MMAPRQETCTCEGPPITLRPIRGIILLTEAMMQTDSTSLKPHNLIASDRVEGTPVRGTDGATIGTIERVMIDKLTGNVAYAVLSFNGLVGVGQRRLPIPWRQLPITSTSPRTNSARRPKSRTSTGATAAVKSNAAMTAG